MYRVIKEALETVPELAPQMTAQGPKPRIIPLSDLVATSDAPFVMVASMGATEEKALDGKVMWTDERFELAFEAETIDQCISICEKAQEALEALEGSELSEKYILSVEITRTKNDGLNEATLLMVRPISVTIRWWPLDEE